MILPDYKELSGGFTDNFVRRVGDHVLKSGSTVANEFNWYRAYRDKQSIPHIYSNDPGGINMEFIPAVGRFTIDAILSLIDVYKDYPKLNHLKFQAYRDKITAHLYNNPVHNSSKLIKALEQIDVPATFCHGDLSINNIIASADGMKLIDPLYGENFGSYWLDYAKLAFSLKFYRGDVSLYNEVVARTGVQKVLIVSECVRVATYRPKFNFITENLINEL